MTLPTTVGHTIIPYPKGSTLAELMVVLGMIGVALTGGVLC
jgi:prepilin-type N-terminal cleavage/methylation domain-containing protein